ncbi:MAG: hypothetical protein ABSC73_09570 [Acidimicrobiales bacterium]|jgi:cytochrome c biogenesis protein CcdA
MTSSEIVQAQPQGQPGLYARFQHFVVRWLILVTVVWFVLMLIIGNSTSHFEDNCERVGIVIISLWGCLILIAVFRFIWRVSGVAFTPIPGPAEIETQLRAYLGRQPTLEEMNAAQQMIKTRRNEALLGLGAVFGGMYLGGRALKGR